MATRPSRDHAAKRREFHALREMPQRQAMGFQFILQRRHADPALDARRPAGLVDFQNPVEPRQVEADGAVESASDRRLHATAHGGAPAEGNYCGIGPHGVLKDGGNVGLRANVGDEVGRVAIVPKELAGVVGVGFSVGVQEPVALGACGERRKRGGNRQPRLVQFDRIFTRRLADFEFSAKTLAHARCHQLSLDVRYPVAFITPAD